MFAGVPVVGWCVIKFTPPLYKGVFHLTGSDLCYLGRSFHHFGKPWGNIGNAKRMFGNKFALLGKKWRKKQVKEFFCFFLISTILNISTSVSAPPRQ